MGEKDTGGQENKEEVRVNYGRYFPIEKGSKNGFSFWGEN